MKAGQVRFNLFWVSLCRVNVSLDTLSTKTFHPVNYFKANEPS